MSEPDPSSLAPSQDKRSPRAQRAAFREDPNGVLDCSTSRIVRNGQHVVKSGSSVYSEEFRALDHAHHHGVPVPVVHRAPLLDHGAMIEMDFVDGECLEDVWPSLDGKQKQSIAEQLRDIVTTMRQRRHCLDTIGSLGGPARDVRRFSVHDGGVIFNEAEFNDFVLDFVPNTPSMVRDALTPLMGVNSQILFTHGDLSPRNIIVKGDRIQALLDWACAGWYPEYWEYVKFVDRPTACDDWKEYASTIFEEKYPKELVTFQALKQWQFP